MTPIADMVQEMLARGVPAETVVMAVRGAELASKNSTGIPPDSAAEKRRAYDRERKRKKANSTGIPPDSTGTPQKALILKNLKDKKVRATKHPLPPEWTPSEDHFAYGEKRGYSRSGVLDKAEDLRIWAGSSGAQKADWGLTFLGFLRRDGPKLHQSMSAAPNPNLTCITPDSRSWNAWKSYFRDAGKNTHAALMDKCASDGKPFTVQSEWPPGKAA